MIEVNIMREKTKYRSKEEKEKLINRLSRIEGQIRGIKQMIIEDRYCDDVLIQISASMKSLKSLGNEMLKNHLATCVVEKIKQEDDRVIDEVIDLFSRLN